MHSPFRSALHAPCPSATMASADFSPRFPASPFQAPGEISPGKNAVLRCTTAGFTPPEPWSSELRDLVLARPARHRLGSGSCTSARSFATRFLPTVGRPSAVAVRFDRDDLLSTGLAPARQRPCWAHQKKRGDKSPLPMERIYVATLFLLLGGLLLRSSLLGLLLRGYGNSPPFPDDGDLGPRQSIWHLSTLIKILLRGQM